MYQDNQVPLTSFGKMLEIYNQRYHANNWKGFLYSPKCRSSFFIEACFVVLILLVYQGLQKIPI